MRDANLKLDPKSLYFQKKVKYLGYVLSGEDVHTNSCQK